MRFMLSLCFIGAATALADGPDVVLNQLVNPGQYASTPQIAALSAGSEICNVGDVPVAFMFLPNTNHPIYVQNLYRLHEGRLLHIGQSWVKHEFFALQNNGCQLGCDPENGTLLGTGCSTLGGAGLSSGPNLGPRSAVNPVDVSFAGGTANDHTGHDHSSGISHGLQVRHADLGWPDAQYTYEGIYLAADDTAAGNLENNTATREVEFLGSAPNWTVSEVGSTVDTPAILSWPDASFDTHDSGAQDGLMIAAARVTPMKGGLYQYEYAVMNMTSARGGRAFRVPVGNAAIIDAGFHAVFSHDEGWSNDAWDGTVAAGHIEWTTSAHATDPNANALRWGTMYNFWFTANQPPVDSSVRLERFSPGPGPLSIEFELEAPAPVLCANGDSNDIVSSFPPDGAIDARFPHDANDADVAFDAWTQVTLTFENDGVDLTPESFIIELIGSGTTPHITDIENIGADTVTLFLSPGVAPRTLMKLGYACGIVDVRFGALPGDVNQDGFSSPLDILALIDALNTAETDAFWATDVNRSGETTPADILAVIDLLNGAGAFEPWNGISLPEE
jgi:hypothetical protein